MIENLTVHIREDVKAPMTEGRVPLRVEALYEINRGPKVVSVPLAIGVKDKVDEIGQSLEASVTALHSRISRHGGAPCLASDMLVALGAIGDPRAILAIVQVAAERRRKALEIRAKEKQTSQDIKDEKAKAAAKAAVAKKAPALKKKSKGLFRG